VRGDPDEIPVTPAMTKAGMEELTDHPFPFSKREIRYLMECVYRAMEAERREQAARKAKPKTIPDS
jgi:hypothetical protein